MKKIMLLGAISALLLVFAACKFAMDERPDARSGDIVPVTNITGVPTGSDLYIETALSATVIPEDATNKLIVWSIKDGGGTNSTLAGNKLTANAFGTVTVTATIANGLAAGEDYTQDFPILFFDKSTIVQSITEIPSRVMIGDYELAGLVLPTKAINTTILWSVKSAGTTGASMYGNVLRTTGPGTVVLTAKVTNGLGAGVDYEEDFEFTVLRPVYAAGWYSPTKYGIYVSPNIRACYWIDGQCYPLSVPAATPYLFSAGRDMAVAGGKVYVAGHHADGTLSAPDSINAITSDTACYWVNGEYTKLPSTGTFSRSYAIAADGNTVYIIGFDGDSSVANPSYNSGRLCYWKIEGDGTATQHLLPGAYNSTGSNYGGSWDASIYTGKVFIVNGGRMYIPFTYNNKNYLWDGGDSPGSVQEIPVITSNTYNINYIDIIRGRLCMAGGEEDTYSPFYYFEGDSAPTLLDNNGLTDGNVYSSVVDQDGSIWFYGLLMERGLSNPYFWNAATRRASYLGLHEAYRPEIIALADGVLYMPAVAGDTSDGYTEGYTMLEVAKFSMASEYFFQRLLGPEGEEYITVAEIVVP